MIKRDMHHVSPSSQRYSRACQAKLMIAKGSKVCFVLQDDKEMTQERLEEALGQALEQLQHLQVSMPTCSPENLS